MVKYQQNAIQTQFDLRAYSNRWRGETTIQCVPSIRTCRCYFHRSIMAPCPVFRCREGRNTRKAFQGRWLRMVETSPSHITMPMAAYVFKVCRTVGHTWFVDEVCLQTKPKLSQLRLKYLSPNQKNIASFVLIFCANFPTSVKWVPSHAGFCFSINLAPCRWNNFARSRFGECHESQWSPQSKRRTILAINFFSGGTASLKDSWKQ